MTRSQKINLDNNFGAMSVVTTNVSCREEYLTTVFLKNKLWDAVVTNNVDDAIYSHAKFCDMCQLFSPLADKLDSSDPRVQEEVKRELMVLASLNATPVGPLN